MKDEKKRCCFGGGTELRSKTLCGETSLRGFPLAKASAPAKPGREVFGTPFPAEVRGDVCLWQTLAYPRNAPVR
jgi:hypothetical protein